MKSDQKFGGKYRNQQMLSSLHTSQLAPVQLELLLSRSYAELKPAEQPKANVFPAQPIVELFRRAISTGVTSQAQQAASASRASVQAPNFQLPGALIGPAPLLQLPGATILPLLSTEQKKSQIRATKKQASTVSVTTVQKEFGSFGQRIDIPNMYIDVFSYSRLIGERAKQIASGAPATVDTTGIRSAFDIAIREFQEKRFPMRLQRLMPNGLFDVLDPNQMALVDPSKLYEVKSKSIEVPLEEEKASVQENAVSDLVSAMEEVNLQEYEIDEFDDTGFPYPSINLITRELLGKAYLLDRHSRSIGVDIEGRPAVVFRQFDNELNNISQIVQAKQVYKVRLQVMKQGELTLLPSVLQVWGSKKYRNDNFRNELLAARDPYNYIWQLRTKYGFKIPTPFSPLYSALVVRELGNHVPNPSSLRVLDASSGWGDRLIGSIGLGVKEYTGVDPNIDVFEGYSKILELYGFKVRTSEKASNGTPYFIVGEKEGMVRKLICAPFESPKLTLERGYDVAFTSPPFFDYEVYSDKNPQYKDWIKDFYIPYVGRIIEHLAVGGALGLYIDDTSAGSIMSFINSIPALFTNTIREGTILLESLRDSAQRPVHVFRKYRA